MPLTRVTLTGADDLVSPHALLGLAQDFPFVEFGILASPQGMSPRQPSVAWRHNLVRHAQRQATPLALHLCGRWVRDLLRGEVTFPPELTDGFQRVQLNIGPHPTLAHLPAFAEAVRRLWPQKEVIVQVASSEGALVLGAYHHTAWNAVPLFDQSGGRGRMPPAWPRPFLFLEGWWLPHGYAGGLGPATLAAALPRILEIAGEAPCWIDLETGLRTAQDMFSVALAREVLTLAAPFVRQEVTP